MVVISIDLTHRETDELVGYEHIQRDRSGNLSFGDSRTAISFCSEYAVDLAVDFYQDIVDHYHKR